MLSPNFDTVEVSTNLKEGDSTVDIGVLKAYGDNPNSFFLIKSILIDMMIAQH